MLFLRGRPKVGITFSASLEGLVLAVKSKKKVADHERWLFW